MRLSRRRVAAGVLVLAFLALAARFVFPSVVFLVSGVVFTRKWSRQASQGRDHLFFETDYQELLAACRTLSRRTVTDGLQRRSYFNVCFGERDAETLSFPQVILDLKPARVLTNWRGEGQVIIELFPGPEWSGVTAFPEGSEGHGAVKLIEGLWYFDPMYSEAHPQYMKRIDAVIAEGRRRREQRQSVLTPQSAAQ